MFLFSWWQLMFLLLSETVPRNKFSVLIFFLVILKTEKRQQKRTAFLTAERAVCSTKYKNTK